MRRKPLVMTFVERLSPVVIAVIATVVFCLGHATVLLLNDHASRMMYTAIGFRWLVVMYAEYGVGFFLLWLLFIHFVRPQRPQ